MLYRGAPVGGEPVADAVHDVRGGVHAALIEAVHGPELLVIGCNQMPRILRGGPSGCCLRAEGAIAIRGRALGRLGEVVGRGLRRQSAIRSSTMSE